MSNKPLLFFATFLIIFISIFSSSAFAWTKSLDDSLIAYYKLDEPSGSLAESVFGINNGSIDGAVTQNVNGILGKANSVGGTGAHSNLSTVNGLNGVSEFTVNLWINSSANVATKNIIKRGKDTATFTILDRGNMQYTCSAYVGGVEDGTSSGKAATPNEWTMVTCKYNQTGVFLYVNTTLVGSKGLTGTTNFEGNSHDMISVGARWDNANPWTGIYDEIGIWNRSLNFTDIQDLWNNGAGIPYLKSDLIFPKVIVNAPANTTYTRNTIRFEVNATDNIAIDSCYYSLNNGVDNFSMSASGSNYTATNTTMKQGGIRVNYYCNDTGNNQNNTEFKDIYIDSIPPVCVLISRVPTDITDTSNGTFNVLLNCTDASGVNNTYNGSRYWAFATRTTDSFQLSAGVPNRWSIRPPENNLAQVGTGLAAYGNIFRAQGRGRSFWYEKLNASLPLGDMNLTSWFLYDNYSYAAEDGHYGYLNLTQESAIATIFNYTAPSVRLSAFRQNVPLSYDSLISESKKNLTINKNIQVLVLRNDLEAMKGSANYTITTFRDVGVTATPPTATLRAFYCNSSYSPVGGISVLLSPNCVSINAITVASLTPAILTVANSSYSQGFYSVTNNKIGGIVATPLHYYYYDTLESNPLRGFNYRYVNGSTITNVSFNDTQRTWTSTNNGVAWTQYPATLDLMEFTTKGTNDEFQFGYCVYDLLGNIGCNSTVFKDEITPTNHPISNPSIVEYNSTVSPDDIFLNSTHSKTMNIRIGCAKDPDSVGNVTHNLTLRNDDGTFNFTINASYLCPLDAPRWVDFNTALVIDGVYRMNVTAVAGDNLNDVESYLTPANFTIDNTKPKVIIYSPANSTYFSGTVNFEVNATDNFAVDSCLYSFNGGTDNYSMSASGSNFTASNTTMKSGGIKVNYYCNDTANNWNVTEFKNFYVDNQPPSVTIFSPANATYTNSSILFEVRAIDDVSMTNGSCWFTLNLGLFNYTLTNTTGVNNYTFLNTTVSDKSQKMIAYCNDSSNHVNATTTRSFRVILPESSKCGSGFTFLKSSLTNERPFGQLCYWRSF